MTVNFALRFGRTHDPECDCREAEAPSAEASSKDAFKGRHFEASLILQAVCWYLRYPLSYRDIEELFLERGLEVDRATYAKMIMTV